MPVFTPEKAMLYISKTPVIVDTLLAGVDQARAANARTAPAEWSVLEIMAHLHDYESIFKERTNIILKEERGAFPAYDPDQLAVERQYNVQDFRMVCLSWKTARKVNLSNLESLLPESWTRTGMHPSFGEMTLLDLWLNVALHDLNHSEQIIRSLAATA
jgi:hypothetical protein